MGGYDEHPNIREELMLTQTQREKWLPTIDKYAQKIGQYAAYRLSQDEYIGTMEHSDQAEETIKAQGYEYSGLAALKYHPVTGKADNGSYRKVLTDYPVWLSKSSPLRDFDPNELQYHVHLWEREYGVEVFSHFEVVPDLSTPKPSLKRNKTHYRPTHGETYLRGKSCKEIEELF